MKNSTWWSSACRWTSSSTRCSKETFTTRWLWLASSLLPRRVDVDGRDCFGQTIPGRGLAGISDRLPAPLGLRGCGPRRPGDRDWPPIAADSVAVSEFKRTLIAVKVGIPREVKNHEYRVAITPAGVHELSRHGHEVFLETDAGVGSSISNDEYVAAGATILPTADDVWQTGELILKVKEPIAEEYHRMRKGQVLFTYLHLAASRECTDALTASGVTAIAYDTVQPAHRPLPLLPPLSEAAGRLAPQVCAYHLMRQGGGRGVLMGGVSGVYAAKVVVLGAGVSGMNSAAIALGMQAEVLLLDRNIDKLRQADRIYQGHLQTIASNKYEVEQACLDADLVIGAVLVPGAKAPMLVSDDLVSRMKPG